MLCPICSHSESVVKDSRVAEDSSSIRRRRECLGCESRFTTYEKIYLKDIFVIKQSGDKEFFNKEKLKLSIHMAIRKRKVNLQKVEDIVMQIYNELCQLNEQEISSKYLGELVLKHLKTLDKVAFVRFASVYKDFKVTEDFIEFLKEI